MDTPGTGITDTAPATRDVDAGTGGERVLPAILLGGAVGAGALSGAYRTYRGVQGYFENRRYWEDYQRNTGVRPRYGYRQGYNYDWTSTLSGLSQMANASSYGYYGYNQEWWK